MTTLAAPILALCAFLVGFAWGRRSSRPRWTVTGEECAYDRRCDGHKVATFASYHKARHIADRYNGEAP